MKGTSSGTRRGQGYALKKGEEVVCVSRHNQVDGAGDWGSNACAWDHTRFMGKEGRGSMMPFGGGVSMVSLFEKFDDKSADKAPFFFAV